MNLFCVTIFYETTMRIFVLFACQLNDRTIGHLQDICSIKLMQSSNRLQIGSYLIQYLTRNICQEQ
ncbi:hypothetical protein BpHYR1_007603 [Brachionus plicatilis]|uniref:Uncharacterized protein n=1 Tax=Brachionus plicatilis TaxID=10195 RepID=A0A3M7R259_BRAPC|nr:hypothetical protein BpHYR1_007603 [Brachionus plicatilis]